MVEETSLVLARIQEIERRDDAQILASLSGELIEEYVYSFKDSRGRRQTGLSWAGTREMAQLRGNIQIDNSPDISETDDYFRVVVRAMDFLRNVAVLGGCHQPKKMRIKVINDNGEPTGEYITVDDDFAFQKAISKAQRNAIKNLMPETVIKMLVSKLLEKQKGKQSPKKSPPQAATEIEDLPAPPLPTDNRSILWENVNGLLARLKPSLTDNTISRWFQTHYLVDVDTAIFANKQPPEYITKKMLDHFHNSLLAYEANIKNKG